MAEPAEEKEGQHEEEEEEEEVEEVHEEVEEQYAEEEEYLKHLVEEELEEEEMIAHLKEEEMKQDNEQQKEQMAQEVKEEEEHLVHLAEEELEEEEHLRHLEEEREEEEQEVIARLIEEEQKELVQVENLSDEKYDAEQEEQSDNADELDDTATLTEEDFTDLYDGEVPEHVPVRCGKSKVAAVSHGSGQAVEHPATAAAASHRFMVDKVTGQVVVQSDTTEAVSRYFVDETTGEVVELTVTSLPFGYFVDEETGEVRESRSTDVIRKDDVMLEFTYGDDTDFPAPSHVSVMDKPAKDAAPGRMDISPLEQYQSDVSVRFSESEAFQVTSARCRLSQTVGELRQRIAINLHIPCRVIRLLHHGIELEDCVFLQSLELEPGGALQLEVESANPEKYPIPRFHLSDEDVTPLVIAVRIMEDGVAEKFVEVEIIQARIPKRYLGGYRHKISGTLYHHAMVQTMPRKRKPDDRIYNSRQTQTVEQRHLALQTNRDTSTQFTGIGVYIPNLTDKLIEPQKYFEGDEFQQVKLNKIITVQTYFRRFLAKCRSAQLRQRHRCVAEREKITGLMGELLSKQRVNHDLERRMDPRTKDDFELLYSAIEKWRVEEIALIDATLTGAERKVALAQLLDDEAQLIHCIGRRQQQVVELNNKRNIQNFFKKASAPKIWLNSDGGRTIVDTQSTQRARELQRVYEALMNKSFNQEERLDVLLSIKTLVKAVKTPLQSDLIQLIDREADLLTRGFSDKSLEGLRKRINHMFLQFVKMPSHNPEVARLLKVPEDRLAFKNDQHVCKKCRRFLQTMDFQLDCGDLSTSICHDCERLRNIANQRRSNNIYKMMLKDLQKNEDKYNDGPRIAYIIQPKDLQYLVTFIWGAKSALSENRDIFNLVLPRWDKTKQWSPWNTILLTREEAAAHEKLTDIYQDYEPVFIHEVQLHHTRARNFFRHLPSIEQHMPLTCDPSPEALAQAMEVKKFMRPAMLRPIPCTLSPWPIRYKYHPRRPAHL